MSRILSAEPLGLRQSVEEHESPSETPEVEEFELVLGRRQVASVTFLALMILAVFSGVSFLAGKGISSSKEAVSQPAPLPQPPPAPAIEVTTAPAPLLPPPEVPLFAEPVPKAIYIQMGAVEKGVAVIFAEGLRKRGFDAFVASGPNGKVFRVLIGPFRNAEAYQTAKKAVGDIGLDNFARQYQN